VWKRTRHSQRGKQDADSKALKQADLALLKLAAQEGHIDLKYLDESGCCLESLVSYSSARIGELKPTRRMDTGASYGHLEKLPYCKRTKAESAALPQLFSIRCELIEVPLRLNPPSYLYDRPSLRILFPPNHLSINHL
jgi:hypothetical protein